MKYLKGLLWLFIGTALLASCQVVELGTDVPSDLPKDNSTEGQEIILNAFMEGNPETKTALDANYKFTWLPGDEIKIFSAGESAKFTAINSEPSSAAKFKGTISFIMGHDDTGDISYSWALYPYSSSASYAEPEGITKTAVITTVMPSVQTASAGTFDPHAAVSIGRAETLDIYFRNAYSGFYFIFQNRDDISSITVESVNGEYLAGTYSIRMNDSGAKPIPEVASISEQNRYSTMTLYAPNGGTFECNKRYYLTTFPDVVLQQGARFTAHATNGEEATYTLGNTISLDRNLFRKFGSGGGQSIYFDGRIEDPANIANGSSTGWVKPQTNQIWYTTYEHQVFPYAASTATGNVVISNTYDTDADRGVITFAQPLTVLDDQAFYLASPYDPQDVMLKSVSLPESVQIIGKEAFRNNWPLQSVHMGNNVTVIGERAFGNCQSLKEIHLSNSLQALGHYAFSQCISLPGIELPASLTTIPAKWPDWPDMSTVNESGNNPFYFCERLSAFSGPLASADGAFLLTDNGERLVSIAINNPAVENNCIIPAGVKVMGPVSLAFGGFSSIVFPDGLESLESAVFYQCTDITEITIPASLQTLAGDFISSSTIQKVFMKSPTPPALTGTLTGQYKFYVPKGSKDAYLSAWGSQYENRILESDFPADNQIYYEATQEVILTLPQGSPNAFAQAASYDPNSGKGVYTFTAPLTVLDDVLFANSQQAGALTKVALPESLTTIGYGAFSGCQNLTSVTMGNNVTAIKEYAFQRCGFQAIDLSDNLLYIGTGAFSECNYLTNITIPESVINITASWSGDVVSENGYNPFYLCPGLVNFNGKFASSNHAFLINSDYLISFAPANATQKTNCVVPEGVYALWHASFWKAQIETISIPESVNVIGQNALADCYSLQEVIIPSSIVNISKDAFSDDTALTRIVIKKPTAPGLGSNALDNTNSCPIYVPVPIDASYSSGNWANYSNRIVGMAPDAPASNQIFYTRTDHDACTYCYSTGSDLSQPNTVVSNVYYYDATHGLDIGIITFSNDVVVLDDYAFAGPTNTIISNNRRLSSVTLPDCVEVIGDSAFMYVGDADNNSFSLTMGPNVKVIGYGAFRSSKIATVNLPYGVEAIGESAFDNCQMLTSINIPQTVTHFNCWWPNWPDRSTVNEEPGNLFYHCPRLSSFSGKFATSDGAFLVKDGIVYSFAMANTAQGNSCSVPNGVTALAPSSLALAQFSQLTLPESLQTIGNYAMSGCENLSEISIPKNVTSIGDGAFNGNSSLTKITMNSYVPPSLGDNVFNNVPVACKLYIPGSSLHAYNEGAWSGVGFDRVLYQTNNELWLHSAECDGGTNIAQNVIGGTFFNNLTVDVSDAVQVSTNELEPIIPIPSGINPAYINIVRFSGPITKVGADALKVTDGSPSWTWISLPPTVTEIGARAFENCSNLKAFPVPDGGAALTSVGQYAFNQCWVMPGDLDLSNLTSDGLGVNAFYMCKVITSVKLPGYNIPDRAFCNCYALTSVTLTNNTLTSIGELAFLNARITKFGVQGLNSGIDLPNLTTLGQKAFYGSPLTPVNLPSLTTLNFNSLAYNASTTLNLPSITRIGTQAFMRMSNLTSLTLGPNLSILDSDILNNALANVSTLTITFQGPLPPTRAETVFNSDIVDKLQIQVPNAYLSDYQAAFPGVSITGY
jgi:hypothetical protein